MTSDHTPSPHGAPVVVVVPAFNAAPYLDQSLASIAGQTLRPAEVVVADDCSTDTTAEVAETWSGRLPLRVVRLERNQGPSVARAKAIDSSTSPLIALLDADDVWLPDHLQTLVSLHEERDGITMSVSMRWAPGEAIGALSMDLEPVPDPPHQLQELYKRNFAIGHTLFSRALYEKAGGFRGQLRVGEDWDLYIRMVRAGAVVHVARHPTQLYRLTPGGLIWGDQGADDRVRVLELAMSETSARGDVAAIRKGLRAVRADRSLVTAYRLARERRPWAARRAAFGALTGRRRVAVRATAMLLAPRKVASLRTEVRSTPVGRLRG